MRIVWQPHDFEGDLLLRLRFHVKEKFSFAGLPLSTSDDQSRVRKDSFWSLTSGSLLLSILYDAHPSYILFLVSVSSSDVLGIGINIVLPIFSGAIQ